MINKEKKAVIFGTASFAEVAKFYLDNDSCYDVVAFTSTADDRLETFNGLPVVDFRNVQDTYPPENHEMFIAVGQKNLGKIREQFYKEAKDKGYRLLSYLSSDSKCWTDKIGDNCFIFEDNTIQPFVEIGNNVVLWSGNHIGHHSVIEDNCFICSHVVVSGHCRICRNTFIGVNATLRDSIIIESENIIGAGTLILKSTKQNEVYIGNKSRAIEKKSDKIKRL